MCCEFLKGNQKGNPLGGPLKEYTPTYGQIIATSCIVCLSSSWDNLKMLKLYVESGLDMPSIVFGAFGEACDACFLADPLSRSGSEEESEPEAGTSMKSSRQRSVRQSEEFAEARTRNSRCCRRTTPGCGQGDKVHVYAGKLDWLLALAAR